MTQTPGVEVHLPCPPLGAWLPVRLAGLRVGCAAPHQAPRRLRSTLRHWPEIDADAELAEFDALLFGVRLERPHPPDHALARMRPGAWIIELAQPRPRVLADLLGLDRVGLSRARAGQARVLAWLERGFHALEQWESVEPHGVIVTLARVRHNGGA